MVFWSFFKTFVCLGQSVHECTVKKEVCCAFFDCFGLLLIYCCARFSSVKDRKKYCLGFVQYFGVRFWSCDELTCHTETFKTFFTALLFRT